jgi:hypothetical protein
MRANARRASPAKKMVMGIFEGAIWRELQGVQRGAF